MIEYTSRSGEPEALSCPMFICDACGKPIQKTGTVNWAKNYTNDIYQQSPIFALHGSPCVQIYDRWFKTAYPEKDGWSNSSIGIYMFLEHLTGNFKADINAELEELTNFEYHAHTIEPPAIPLPNHFQRIGAYTRNPPLAAH